MSCKEIILSQDDYVKAAQILDNNLDPDIIKAVVKIETSGRSGFIEKYELPIILFEGHVFYSYLKKHGLLETTLSTYTDPKYKTILYPKWTREHYVGGIGEYHRLNLAKSIHFDGAIYSTSYGMFQIMGFNYKECGCSSLPQFEEENYKSASSQLNLFIKYVQSNPSMKKALIRKDWDMFAKLYNGPGYKTNNYDVLLQQEYENIKNK